MQPQTTAGLEQLEQAAFQAAVDRAAESVVQIRTVGGLDRVEGQSLEAGPATGVIVRSDGYIVSSAFHFASRPTSILVRLPGGEQRPAELIGNDDSRMLTLLKVDVDEQLPAAEPTPLDELQVGQWAIAVGRTFVADQVGVSVGIVSALGRKNGRMVQTDASISAANYGGPLLDIFGRTMGILVPMSPQASGVQGESAVAGAEYYDSGIGFAAPLEQVLEVLPRWIEQGRLQRGILGIGLQSGSPYATEPLIKSVWPGSPAAAAGWQANDVILAVDGVEVATQAELRRQIAHRYSGDVVAVRLGRSSEDQFEEIETEVTLAADLAAYRHAFLGVLPMRNDPSSDAPEQSNAGVEIRAAWPGSPADTIGIRPGDRIVQIGKAEISNIGDAWDQLQALNVGDWTELNLERDGELLQFSTQTTSLPGEILPEAAPALAREASPDDDSQGEMDVAEVRFPEHSQVGWIFQSGSTGSRGLILWLGGNGRAEAEAFAADWSDLAKRYRLALVVATPASEEGWTAEDLPFASRLLQHAAQRVGADQRRTVVVGAGKAGQFAYALAMGRELAAGIASIDGPLPRSLTIPRNRPGRRLSILAIDVANSPFSVLIRRDAQQLTEQGYPVALESRPADRVSQDEVSPEVRSIIARWVDGLDRF